MMNWIQYLQARFATNERGAAAVEYALLVTLIAIAIIVTVTTLGTNISDAFDTVGKKIGG